MAIIKHDPKQTGVVVVLIIVLIMSIGVIAVRVKKTKVTSTAIQAQQSTVAITPIIKNEPIDYETIRNPFVKPSFISTNEDNLSKLYTEKHGSFDNNIKPIQWKENKKLPPLEILPINADISNGSKDNKSQQPLSAYTLLTTVKGADGLSAVIKKNESEVKVVQIGDTLSDGYLIKEIEETRVIITNGRNTIIATKPHS